MKVLFAYIRPSASLFLALLFALMGPVSFCSGSAQTGPATCSMACCQDAQMSCCTTSGEPQQTTPAQAPVDGPVVLLQPVETQIGLSLLLTQSLNAVDSLSAIPTESGLSLLIKIGVLRP